jgi:lipid-A-disaccharide synthase
VGNPSITLREFLSKNGSDGEETTPDVPVVALLPGSRKKEVELIFPVQLDAARCVTERCPAQFWVIKAPGITRNQLQTVYESWLSQGNSPLRLEIKEEKGSELLSRVACAIVKSGTSTLEATILHVPFAMVYRISRPSWYLAKPFVDTDTYCLANLIAGEHIVPEFVQDQATGENIGGYVLELLQDRSRREEVSRNLQRASEKLGEQNAYEESAKHISQFLSREGE